MRQQQQSRRVRRDSTHRLLESIERLTDVVDRLVSDLDDVRDEHRVTQKRVGQLQAELDTIKRGQAKMQGVL